MRNVNLTKLAAIAIILAALVNFGATFVVFEPGGPEPVLPTEGEEVFSPVEDELNEDVGGLTSTTGIAVVVISVIFLITGGGLLAGRGWRLGAMMALGADITFKLINFIAQILVGDPLLDALPAIALIIVEGVLISVLWSERREHYHDPAALRTPADATKHGSRQSEQRSETP